MLQRGGIVWLFAVVLSVVLPVNSSADATWLYSVQLSAQVRTSPAEITLSWPQDIYGADSYTVYRKLKDETSWSGGTVLPGNRTSFTDTNVAPGGAYEYQVVKQASLGYVGYGYIFAGINAPFTEDRGSLVLVMAAESVANLGNEVNQLISDLTGDGWQVKPHTVSANDSPATVRSAIISEYNNSPSRVKAVLLLGRVPILMSGTLEYDSHGARPMPADGFYGDIDGNWNESQPPENRPSYLPSDLELMVGRVDFSNLPGIGAPSPWPDETTALRNYLNKDHRWRQKQLTARRKAVMANRVGDFNGQAYAADGYRLFAATVGPGNTDEANVADAGPPEQRWISYVTSDSYLFSYGCGAGQDALISQLGTHDIYHDVYSTDVVAMNARSVFNMFFGSHFGDWSRTDNIMRAMLMTDTALTSCLDGTPHWFMHHMALGEPIGYSVRLSANNVDLYRNQSNALPRAILVSLLGDPTLRMEMIAPPVNATGSGNNGSAYLNWGASSDAVGYHVYRAATAAGPFTRLTTTPLTGTSFVDSTSFGSHLRTYMIRAIGISTNASGTYYNPSQGSFVTVDVSGQAPPGTNITTLEARRLPDASGSIQLSWTSTPGTIYHVESIVLLNNNDWEDLSGPIQAESTNTSFIDYNAKFYGSRFYRLVTSP